MKPDYKNCQLNIVATIEDHFGERVQYFSPIPELKKIMNQKKHIFLIVLDGMGTKIVEKNLSENSFIRNHYLKTISCIYPSTTACVTSSILSAKLPNDTGFYGWHQYFKEFNRDIVVLRNEDYYTGERLSTRLPISYKRFFDKYDDISTYILYPAWDLERGYKNFKSQVDKMIDISDSKEKTFTYCYCDEPDSSIHNKGTDSGKVKRVLNRIDKELQYLNNHMKEDSVVIVTADHGLIDSKIIYLEDYPDIIDLLELRPSLEARCTTFKVNNMERFKRLFEYHFPIGFELYTKDEYLKTDYVYHTNTEYRFEEFLFDYIAVANDKFSFLLYHKQGKMKAMHAGVTEDEMMVPLIVFDK